MTNFLEEKIVSAGYRKFGSMCVNVSDDDTNEYFTSSDSICILSPHIDTMNSRCYCGASLSLESKYRTTEWKCQCCFKTIQKHNTPYICNSKEECIYKNTKANSSYKCCKECFEWNGSVIQYVELKTNDNDNFGGHLQSFLYKKFKATLSRIS